METEIRNKMIVALEREGLDVNGHFDPIMLYTFFSSEERKARVIVGEYGYTLKLYMPHGKKSDDKAAEWEIVRREDAP